jgi:hypothetical protein
VLLRHRGSVAEGAKRPLKIAHPSTLKQNQPATNDEICGRAGWAHLFPALTCSAAKQTNVTSHLARLQGHKQAHGARMDHRTVLAQHHLRSGEHLGFTR